MLTLWRVDDASTAALMTAFYARLATGVGRGEALRQAQLALARGELGEGAWRHPRFWAGVVQSGRDGPLRLGCD